MKKKRATKAKAVRNLSAKSVSAKRASGVRGGVKKKTGAQQTETYLTITMEDPKLSSY